MDHVNIDFVCDTEDCTHWEQGTCKYADTITIQEQCCVDYESKAGICSLVLEHRNFAPPARMVQIANNAIDSLEELLNGRALYDALAGSLKMDDEEILAAGFTTLKEFMGEADEDEKQ